MNKASQISFWKLDEIDAVQRAQLLQRTEADMSEYLRNRSRPIIEACQAAGRRARWQNMARRFDGADISDRYICMSLLKSLQVAATVRLTGIPGKPLSMRQTILRRYHEAQKPGEMTMQEVRRGSFVGESGFLPIPSVACYVPRGKGSFPSVLMMNAIPAVVAGVKRVIVITPPGKDGSVDAATLVATQLIAGKFNCNIDVFKCGGAQAVAAVAYGTETVPVAVRLSGRALHG